MGCSSEDYSFGDLNAPSNVVINTEIVGQTEATPNGDGSGVVHISVDADDALAYKIDFGTANSINLTPFNGEITKQFTKPGVIDYRITVVVYGPGGAATTVTKDITVESVFTPDSQLVSDLTGDGSKTWVVDKSTSGHFGVGPYNDGSVWPEWYSAGIEDKAECCNCFYTATFTFKKEGENFTLDVSAPDGVFTKTGDLTTLPGIPDEGDEGCYDGYTGGTSPFNFIPSSSGIPASTPSTKTSIELVGNDTFIGYGAVLKEYEILEITEDYVYLRVQGTEPGNAWYVRLVPAS
ncbi:MAG: hypothetical protein WBL21_09205 [Salinimicrobium sp.]